MGYVYFPSISSSLEMEKLKSSFFDFFNTSEKAISPLTTSKCLGVVTPTTVAAHRGDVTCSHGT